MNTIIASAPARGNYAVRNPWIDLRAGDMADVSASAVAGEAICDLIDAAGPLTLRDIAGGLDVSLRRVALRVRRMVAVRALRQDEFGRYRLSGACADRA